MEELKFNQAKQMVAAFIVNLSNRNKLTELGLSFPNQDEYQNSKLNIAFVGQYSSGKSSLIKGLTGLDDIPIGSGVTTDQVTKYDYKDLVVWDTPGILAGEREQHDEASFAAMDQADLLVYVITNELFDDVVGAAFRDLCFTKGREKEILLVVNKSQRDSGTVETKLNGIAEVLEPRIPEDFPIVFVDAESYFESLQEEDEEDKAELMTLSNFSGFIEAIDKFSQERGLLGKVTTPLAAMHTQLEELLGKLAAEDPTQEALVELLQQKMRILKSSQKQLQEQFDGNLAEMEQNILLIGDELAESVDDGLNEADFKQIQQRSADDVLAQVKQTQLKLEKIVDSALSTLESDLRELDTSPLAESLKAALSDHFQATEQLNAKADIDIETHNIGDKYESSVKTQRTLKSAEKGFSWLSNQAINKTAKEGMKAASGSNLHKAVLEVGHFFGAKFKPYQAINIAEKIGSVAKFIGPVMALIGVIVQINDDIQQEKCAADRMAARRDIRKNYREIFLELRNEFVKRMDELSTSFYTTEIRHVSEALQDLQSTSEANIEQRQQIEKAISELNNLRDRLVLG
ncbi:GTP-binding protein [Vibrio vulnificus]|uniref:GTPase domain-containing protein n=1 Tax=Vibrio vulnificus TaxID=672 RepID=UPI0018DC7C8B|nr:GTPase domain-containing protein [Vibrio vulnificus]EGR0788487.1 GTP-binding protein [Vibrio vulnificus]EGR0797059.1 GTP-binding protein [Vibrio vulnificus]EGR0813800.1 GTP-binding protein [Vibrio vulnificus]EGR0826196.1 GTP-binding protein [Vibrio vulnificus]EGR0848383.1 GTP-binding protein [Vibrio vulnificus]